MPKTYDFAISARPNEFLTLEQIRRTAPAIFADGAHESRSERTYGFVDTEELLTALCNEGYGVTQAMQARARTGDRFLHARHLLEFTHRDFLANTFDLRPRVVLVNDSLGTSTYQLWFGLFRYICRNGLICMLQGEEYRITHRKANVYGIVEGTLELAKNAGEVLDKTVQMRSIPLRREEQLALAEQALSLRYGGEAPRGITPAGILRPRRAEDREPNLFNTFNIVQERLDQGGFVRDPETYESATIRPVNDVRKKVTLNSALYTLTEQIRRIHTGEPLLETAVVDAE